MTIKMQHIDGDTTINLIEIEPGKYEVSLSEGSQGIIRCETTKIYHVAVREYLQFIANEAACYDPHNFLMIEGLVKTVPYPTAG